MTLEIIKLQKFLQQQKNKIMSQLLLLHADFLKRTADHMLIYKSKTILKINLPVPEKGLISGYVHNLNIPFEPSKFILSPLLI